jgi:large subunit ribosomal protein L19
MSNVMDRLEAGMLRSDLPKITPGDTVKVHVKVKEGEKERIQVFQGIVIGIKGGGMRTSFTVRKVSAGVGVERIFPMHSPSIDHMDVVRSGKVRRAKLYFLRAKLGKAGRLKERRQIVAE